MLCSDSSAHVFAANSFDLWFCQLLTKYILKPNINWMHACKCSSLNMLHLCAGHMLEDSKMAELRKRCTSVLSAVGLSRHSGFSIAASNSQPALSLTSSSWTALLQRSSASQKSRADTTSH